MRRPSPHFLHVVLLRSRIHSYGLRYALSVFLGDRTDRLRQPLSDALTVRRLQSLTTNASEKRVLVIPFFGVVRLTRFIRRRKHLFEQARHLEALLDAVIQDDFDDRRVARREPFGNFSL